jgi:hypothetical protein
MFARSKICSIFSYSEHVLSGSYSVCKITLSLIYITVGGEGKMEMSRGSKMAETVSEHV